MNKKWLATSLCAVTIFASSFTATKAAGLNEEAKSDLKPQYTQIVKGENYHDIALKLLNQIFTINKGYNFDLLKELVKIANNTQNLNNEKVTSNVEQQSTAKEVPNTSTGKNTSSNEKVEVPTSNNNSETKTEKVKTPVSNNTKNSSNSNSQKAEAPAKTTTQSATQLVSEFEKQVVALTNAEREKAGLKPFEIYSPLMKVAHAKSEDMAKNHYFSHTSPTYGSPFDQMSAAGISYRSAGENIAQGQRTPQQVVQAWMQSPGHRQNILNANYTHIGVGFVENGYYWTQQFIQL